jgi:branched-chain amino acid transport system ATP-binding protein
VLLEIKDVWIHYRKVAAVKGISIAVEEGQIVTLIGANGAGKSTTLRTVSGLKRVTSGEISFGGERIDRMAPDRITAMGIAHVPEGRHVFPYLSVMENLEMGAYLRRDKAAVAKGYDEIFERFPRLKERRKQHAGTLSGGEQQMLAMGRALMSNPKVIMMDEPSLGLSPIMCIEIAKIIKSLHGAGRTIVLVEQNARLALALADTGYVLETGEVVLQGDAKDLRTNDQVQHTYLGITPDA